MLFAAWWCRCEDQGRWHGSAVDSPRQLICILLMVFRQCKWFLDSANVFVGFVNSPGNAAWLRRHCK